MQKTNSVPTVVTKRAHRKKRYAAESSSCWKSKLSLTTRAEAIRKSYVAGERPCRVGGTAQFRGVYVAHKMQTLVLTFLLAFGLPFLSRNWFLPVTRHRVNYRACESDKIRCESILWSSLKTYFNQCPVDNYDNYIRSRHDETRKHSINYSSTVNIAWQYKWETILQNF